MKQIKFTFKKYFRDNYPIEYRPPLHLTLEDKIKDDLLKRGYLIKDIKERKVIEISAIVARANVPLKERQKLQKDIDKNKENKTKTYILMK